MTKYEVYLGEDDYCTVIVKADDWSISSTQLFFYQNKNPIAVFQLDNICGFMEREECE